MRLKLRLTSLLVSCALLAAGCGDSNTGSGGAGGEGAAGGQGGAGAAGAAGGTGGGTTTTSGGGAGGGTGVPAEPGALFAFLQSGAYKAFTGESAPHASAGPHGGAVRVYVDPLLEASLAAGNAEHPKGAASVKELSVVNGEPGGWAVFVKTEDTSNGGDGIYWYEIFSTTNGDNPPFSGNGIPLCKNCHAGGADFYLSTYPLQ